MPSTTAKCSHCGHELKPAVIKVNGHEYTIGWMECQCQGAIQEREQQAAFDAERKQLIAQAQRFQTCGIPPRFVQAEHPMAKHLSDKVSQGHGLFIHGPVGTGKTTLATAIAWILIPNYQVRFAVASELAQSMRSFDHEDMEETARVIRSGVLILDDLDKVNATPYACERFWDLVNARYNRELPTIFTANVPLADIASKFGGATGEAIASRIYEMTDDVALTGEDRRLA